MSPPKNNIGLFDTTHLHHGFLQALFRFGKSTHHLIADEPAVKEQVSTWHSAVSTKPMTVLNSSEFYGATDSGITHLHCPQLASSDHVWARNRYRPHSCAISQVLESSRIHIDVGAVCGWLTAPYFSYDTLVVCSHDIQKHLEETCEQYRSYFSLRFSSKNVPLLNFSVIPPGIDHSVFRPATPSEHRNAQELFDIPEHDVAILCIFDPSTISHGSLTHWLGHLSESARTVSSQVHLIAAQTQDGGKHELSITEIMRVIAPNVKLHVTRLDSSLVHPAVWHAADIFVTFDDPLLKSGFSCGIAEASACGLPVLAANGIGVNDLVKDSESGYVIPIQTTVKSSSFHFLDTNKHHHTTVDGKKIRDDLSRLLHDKELRASMGRAGRKHIEENFAWPVVTKRFEDLWEQQDKLRKEYVNQRVVSSGSSATLGLTLGFLQPLIKDLSQDLIVFKTPNSLERLSFVWGMDKYGLNESVIKAGMTSLRSYIDAATEGVSIAGLNTLGCASETTAWLMRHNFLDFKRDQ